MVGNSGSGKTTLGRRLAGALEITYVELDGIYHQPGWQDPDPETFLAQVAAVAETDDWVIDGNYRLAVSEGPVWRHADTVVWIDLPRRTVMRRITARTVRRVLTREELWNGNREPFGNLLRWDPRRSIIRWAWTQHGDYVRRYAAAMSSPANAHLTFVRLRTSAEVERWLASLPTPPSAE